MKRPQLAVLLMCAPCILSACGGGGGADSTGGASGGGGNSSAHGFQVTGDMEIERAAPPPPCSPTVKC
jgi:hypothetical protein